ncbi:MAG: hypothetical protein JO113_06365 [Candidatus Eremiobacteraeota bacterium]|nr:hypothetical protein [Candidatus Eremiobacteraeota bacterium]
MSRARRADLIYVADDFTRTVYVFTYPRGQWLQELTGFSQPAGECTDAAGDVFVTDDRYSNQSSVVVEYRHGGKDPIATLTTPSTPYGCSVDPITGNLAVVEYNDVAIYRAARGTPKVFTDSDTTRMYYCVYDAAGNLYVSGGGPSSGRQPIFAVMHRGVRSFTNFSVDATFRYPRVPIVWDGRYLAVGDYESWDGSYPVYQVKLSSGKGRVVSKTVLDTKGVQTLPAPPMWIQAGKIILTGKHGPYCCAVGVVGLWNYPIGGHRTRRLVMPHYAILPYGIAVSLAKR